MGTGDRSLMTHWMGSRGNELYYHEWHYVLLAALAGAGMYGKIESYMRWLLMRGLTLLLLLLLLRPLPPHFLIKYN